MIKQYINIFLVKQLYNITFQTFYIFVQDRLYYFYLPNIINNITNIITYLKKKTISPHLENIITTFFLN